MTTKEEVPTIKVVNVANNQEITRLTVWAELETPEQRINSYLKQGQWEKVSIKDYNDGKTTITKILEVQPSENYGLTIEQIKKISSLKRKYANSEINVSRVYDSRTSLTKVFVEVIFKDFTKKNFQF